MVWTVHFTKRAAKKIDKLPKREEELLHLLVLDLESHGPVQSDWKSYSRLSDTTYHCHLSYKWVVCWEVQDKSVKLIEIYYVGSREDAPY